MLAITTGAGLTNPVGQYQRIAPPPVESLVSFLGSLPPTDEGWWSGHLWKNNRRGISNWSATAVLVADIDYETASAPFPEHVQAISELATGKLPGSLFHLTPHGARVAFVLKEPCTDKKQILAAAQSVGTLLSTAIEGTCYKVDDPCTRDLARLFFTPNAIAKGVQRSAEVVVMRREPYSIAELIADAAPPPKIHRSEAFDQTAEKWCADHPIHFKRALDTCPVCGHNECFGTLPGNDQRWHCFSTGHPSDVGIKSANGYHGDALDLEAHARNCKPVDVLRKDGYLNPPRAPQTAAEPAPQPTPQPAFRAWRSRSYLTAVDILAKNARDVLEGRKLELNEMTGHVELGRKQLRDSDLNKIRSLIEQRFVGGVDKNNNEVGLQLSATDVFAAADQVAAAQSYHPVREYLRGLVWDGVPRLDSVAEDILGAARTVLNQAIMRRFFIGGVARVEVPGCKVDTMPILVGRQGALKSTFFRKLAAPWFIDSDIDISKKDAYEQIRCAWIVEWAELESLFRARDATSVKAFLSSGTDTYRPSYGRNVITVERSCVIVGTTNGDEFLTDETGNRRFWPLRVGTINLEAVDEQRDQLWAEAVHAFRAGEQWWLTAQEEAELVLVHEAHRVRDAWEPLIVEWAMAQPYPFTTADVLAKALSKPAGQWGRGDEMRVARVLKNCGFERRTDPKETRSKKWFL